MTDAHILTEQALTLYRNSQIHTVHANDVRFGQAVELLKAQDFDSLVDLLKPAVKLHKVFSTFTGDVQIVGDELLYEGTPVHNYVAQKAVEIVQQGFHPESLLNFIELVMQNPSSRAVNELFQFLEYGNLPITSDGYFLAYKRVKDDYRDVHSGKNDNSVGQVVEMPRNQVDDNPNNTCSTGLHFASREYVRSFWGSKLMVLKIHPADVVSIPVDYNNTKGRCCRYEVVDELQLEEFEQHSFAPVVNDYDAEEAFEEYYEEDYNESDYEDENEQGYDDAEDSNENEESEYVTFAPQLTLADLIEWRNRFRERGGEVYFEADRWLVRYPVDSEGERDLSQHNNFRNAVEFAKTQYVI